MTGCAIVFWHGCGTGPTYDAGMARLTVAALAALGALASAAVGSVHGRMIPVMITCATVAAGMTAWSAAVLSKKLKCSLVS